MPSLPRYRNLRSELEYLDARSQHESRQICSCSGNAGQRKVACSGRRRLGGRRTYFRSLWRGKLDAQWIRFSTFATDTALLCLQTGVCWRPADTRTALARASRSRTRRNCTMSVPGNGIGLQEQWLLVAHGVTSSLPYRTAQRSWPAATQDRSSWRSRKSFALHNEGRVFPTTRSSVRELSQRRVRVAGIERSSVKLSADLGFR